MSALTWLGGGWSNARMLPTVAFAEKIAAGDTGGWGSAVRHAAGWLSPQHPVIDLGRRIPLPQLMLQASALLVYGLARSRGTEPSTISAREVVDWVTERRLPPPPDPPRSIDEAVEMLTLWRHELDDAADRQVRDLGALLRIAGHLVPAPGHRSLERFSSDPVVATWLALVDTEAPGVQPASMMDQFPATLLSLGLHALCEMA
ncbi:hypothetical protein AB0M20_11850 [Actinoplanes sp. NPDC051633]|uniref:hypothetical protein n=1 Tax=Actinoplanes sp. NPDC051633 TaxID=3155670 RepID=UPI00343F36F8